MTVLWILVIFAIVSALHLYVLREVKNGHSATVFTLNLSTMFIVIGQAHPKALPSAFLGIGILMLCIYYHNVDFESIKKFQLNLSKLSASRTSSPNLNSSPKNIFKKILHYLFLNTENKEEIIGDLLEQYEYMQDSGYSNFKRIKNLLRQIFVIKLSLIKTKIENAFTVNRKIDKNN